MFRSLAVVMCMGALGVSALGYTIVRRDGGRFVAAGPVEVRGDRALFELVGGAKGFMRAEDVDLDATERANRDPLLMDFRCRLLPPLRPTVIVDAPPRPPLGLIAPGGQTRDCYSDDDLHPAAAAGGAGDGALTEPVAEGAGPAPTEPDHGPLGAPAKAPWGMVARDRPAALTSRAGGRARIGPRGAGGFAAQPSSR